MDRKKEVEQIVTSFLPKEEGYQKTVLEAMNYSVSAGGKRLRPMLSLRHTVCLAAHQRSLNRLWQP